MSETRTELTERLCTLVATTTELEPGEVGPSSDFYEELGIDSLQKLDVVVATERAFGVKFTDEEAAGAQNVADLAGLIRGRREHGGA
ncbi:acyl carrier protein [Amycolatopsis nigrescens]|uniref:acyl carrier protein n=1 Tax=Amycolatopsis nigrescens TaxID=381445 RepID=UPI00035D7B02|nr:acyl carrier protein [Amycolatopsis nigrescens]